MKYHYYVSNPYQIAKKIAEKKDEKTGFIQKKVHRIGHRDGQNKGMNTTERREIKTHTQYL